jgi:hypothetical protein
MTAYALKRSSSSPFVVKRVPNLSRADTMKKRILPIADINLERRRLKEIPAFDHSFDVEVCAGDLWEGTAREGRSSVVALARGRPPIIVPGNHDLYTLGPEHRRTISDFLRLLRDEAWR